MWSTDLAVQTVPPESLVSLERFVLSKTAILDLVHTTILESWFCICRAVQGLSAISDEHIA